jgi:electron transport complex protein RnfE
MKAFTYELYLILGIFIPLIVTNCAILGRAEAFASKNTIASSVLDGLMMGAGFAIVLLVIGAIREIFGVGTIFANMDLLFGPIAANWNINLFGEGYGFLILVLPPGAFIVTGMLIALKNLIDSKLAQLNATKKEPLKKGAKRMRTTGTIA